MKTAEYRQENVERVLKATLELGEEIGVAELTQKNIAERAKLSTKSLKRYFNTKAELIFEVCKMILVKNFNEIMYRYRAKNPESLSGLKRLELLVKTHNTYTLQNYKSTVFLINADLYCRYHDAENHGKYWEQFRHTHKLQEGIATMIHIGQADGSIRKELPNEEFEYFVSTLCAGFVERMVNDIDCKIKTLEEAIRLSDKLIDTTLKYF